MPINSIVRKRLEAQGFCNLDDDALGELAPWLRWSPEICALIMIIGVALQSPYVLWALAVIAFFGALLPFHPFDLVYNYGVRYLTGTRPLPHQGPQRRFACGVATVWLVATGWAFQVGAIAAGLILGILIILVAGLVSITHFCIPSFIYNSLFRRRVPLR